ncbi:hypothetical protein EV715DRAFT_289565 [Schizophyllum commune]
MHRVLSTYDLVCLISEAVDRPDAYAMALTCRAWKEAALNRVWRDMDFVELMTHLFSLLPVDVYRPPTTKSVTMFHFYGPKWLRSPDHSHYEKLYKYSERVRYLDLREADPSLLSVLSDQPPPRPLFPVLAILKLPPSAFTANNGPSATFMQPFHSASLQQIWATWQAPSNQGQRPEIDLGACVAQTPQLRLSIESSRYLAIMPALNGPRLDIIHGFVLHHLVNDTDWNMLASLPCLEVLKVTWKEYGPASYPRVPSVRHPFRALREFEVATDEDCRPFVARLIKHCDLVRLRSLVLDILNLDEDAPERAPTNNWRILLESIHDHCDPDTLETLDLRDGGELTGVDSGTLELLIPFRRLETLKLNSRGGFRLSDSAVGSLAPGWKHLRTLQIVPSVWYGTSMTGPDAWMNARHVNTCSVKGLLQIAQQCTSLQSLTITVNLKADLVVRIYDQDRPRNTTVTHLDFWNSELADPFTVAQLIVDTFPAAPLYGKVQAAILHDKFTDDSITDLEKRMRTREWVAWDKWEKVFQIMSMVREAKEFDRSRPRESTRTRGIL